MPPIHVWNKSHDVHLKALKLHQTDMCTEKPSYTQLQVYKFKQTDIQCRYIHIVDNKLFFAECV